MNTNVVMLSSVGWASRSDAKESSSIQERERNKSKMVVEKVATDKVTANKWLNL